MSKILTLIGVKLAKKGRKFLFSGASEECNNCKTTLKSVCIENLEKDCIYEIVDIRKIVHPCIIHGEVTVVEVQKASIISAIDAKLAYEGATINFRFPDCVENLCDNYQYCRPTGAKEQKYKILEILGDISSECEQNKRLKLVKLKPSNP